MLSQYDPAVRRYVRRARSPKTPPVTHGTRREGDEIACSCGASWDVGESHP